MHSFCATLYMTKIKSILHEDMCTFMMTFRLIRLRIVNISDKHVTENQNTRLIFNNFFFSKLYPCVIMWKNVVQPEWLQVTI